MASSLKSRPFQRCLLTANALLYVCIVVTGVLVDSNGELPGLTETVSTAVAISLFSLGGLSAIAWLITGRGTARWVALVMLVTYALLALPTFIA